MRLCLLSWEAEAKKTYEILHNTNTFEYAIELENSLWGKNEFVEIVSFERAFLLYREDKIDAFIIPCMRGISLQNGVYERLIRAGIPDEKILYAPLRLIKDDSLSYEEKEKLVCQFSKRNEFDYLALHITDHCNLNCAYCSVMCARVKKPGFASFEKTEKGIMHLKAIIDQISVIRILGGEPTLNPEWIEYCKMVRRHYPLADIEVVTNGTKILQMSKEQLDVLRNYHITLDVSFYPTIGDKIDDIELMLRNEKIEHYITAENEFFSVLYDFENLGNPEHNFKVCRMKFMCLNMYEDTISVCHVPIGLSRAQGFISEEEIAKVVANRIDLTQEGLDATNLYKMLNTPMDVCKFCNQDRVEWKILKSETEKNDIKNWSRVNGG